MSEVLESTPDRVPRYFAGWGRQRKSFGAILRLYKDADMRRRMGAAARARAEELSWSIVDSGRWQSTKRSWQNGLKTVASELAL